MRKFILIALMLSMQCALMAASVIKGKVVDAQTGEAIDYADVIVADLNDKVVATSIVITTGPVVKETTVVKYTAASGLPDWEGDIGGELTYNSIPNRS